MLLHSCLTYIFHSHVRTACQIVYAAISFAFYFALTFSIHKLELFDTFSKPLFYAKPRRINFSFFTGYTIKRWSFDFSHKILSRFRAVSFLLLFNGRNRNFSFFTGYTIKHWSFDFSHKILSRFRAVSFLLLFNGRNRNL